MYTSIRPGQVWLDTAGKRIQAHGGSILYENGVYYWYGENKEHTDGASVCAAIPPKTCITGRMKG